MNPLTFYGYKVDEDPQEFIDEVYKILYAMGVSSSEKAELTNTNSRMWLKLGMCNGGMRGGSVTWEIFKAAFLDRFFPRDMREKKWRISSTFAKEEGFSMNIIWNSLSCPNMLLP